MPLALPPGNGASFFSEMSVHSIGAQGPLSALTGLGLLAANVLADQLGLPVPAVPALVLAGALSAENLGWTSELLAASIAATTLADSLWYVAGRRFGRSAVGILCILSLTPEKCVTQTELRFKRWGGSALILAKFVPGLSVIAPPLAGALRMRWWRFIALTLAGAALWSGTFLLTGRLLGRQVRQALPLITQYVGLSILAATLALALYIGLRWYQRYRLRSALARLSADPLSQERPGRQRT
jgi:membrane protein DedA with SNARE-associated domain